MPSLRPLLPPKAPCQSVISLPSSHVWTKPSPPALKWTRSTTSCQTPREYAPLPTVFVLPPVSRVVWTRHAFEGEAAPQYCRRLENAGELPSVDWNWFCVFPSFVMSPPVIVVL